VKKPDDPIDPVVIPDSVLYPDDGDSGDGDDNTVYVFLPAEHKPKFGKGEADLLNYLAENIKYPEMARAARVSGIVYVTFVVNRKGEVVDPKILRGIGSGCDKEALRVVSNMPKWKPGRQRGKRVSVQFTLPIKYEVRR
jgi:protein TonB